LERIGEADGTTSTGGLEANALHRLLGFNALIEDENHHRIERNGLAGGERTDEARWGRTELKLFGLTERSPRDRARLGADGHAKICRHGEARLRLEKERTRAHPTKAASHGGSDADGQLGALRTSH